MEAADSAATGPAAANPFASLFQAPTAAAPPPATGASPAASHAPNTAPLPNPWAPAAAGAASAGGGAPPAGAECMLANHLSVLLMLGGSCHAHTSYDARCFRGLVPPAVAAKGVLRVLYTSYTGVRHAGMGMFGAGLPGLGRAGGGTPPNVDGMMQAIQNPAMQQVMQQLVAQPGFMEARPSLLICLSTRWQPAGPCCLVESA